MNSKDRENKERMYALLEQQARALVEGESDRVANAANLAALIFHSLPEVNWAGFYFLQDRELVVGPFQGQPACVRIPVGQGVCGRAVSERASQLVPDVHAFPGHIVCDPASRAELVIPLTDPAGEIFGVLDIDSPTRDRFDAEDLAGLERIARLLKP